MNLVCIGGAIRFVQLGIEMRPFFHKRTIIGYPIFASITGAFGYYIHGVEVKQFEILERRKQRLLEKRRRTYEGAAGVYRFQREGWTASETRSLDGLGEPAKRCGESDASLPLRISSDFFPPQGSSSLPSAPATTSPCFRSSSPRMLSSPSL